METCEAEDSDQEQDDLELQSDETQSWIGVIHIPVQEYYNTRGSKSCSVLERVCTLLLLFCPKLTFTQAQETWCLKKDVFRMGWGSNMNSGLGGDGVPPGN